MASSLTLPAGKTIYVSWTTNPAENVTVTAVGLHTETVVFSESGASGSGTFYSVGEGYAFGTGNCGREATSVSISVYYNFNAPLL